MSAKVTLVFALLFITLSSLAPKVKGEISSWFKPPGGWQPPPSNSIVTPKQQHEHADLKNGTAPPKPLHEILNTTKEEMHKARRDTSSAGAAAASAATGAAPVYTGYAVPPSPAYPPTPGYPPPPAYPYPPYGGGFFPGFGGGAGAGFNLGIDAGIGGGIFGGAFPIVEKVIIIIGGGILILIILVILQAAFTKGGFAKAFGFDASVAKSFAGSVDVDAGPFHASKSAAGSMAFDENAHLTQRVMNGVNTRW